MGIRCFGVRLAGLAVLATTAASDVPPARADVAIAVRIPGPERPAAAAAPSRGRFLLPVPGPAHLLTPFRPPPVPWAAGHRGVDLAAPRGSVIRAAGAGTVVFAGPLAGRGVVSIEHLGGLRTTYEPVQATVPAGQQVARGQSIGRLQPGHATCAPADCLHWGARIGPSSYVDPMMLLTGWRVRLLPWDGL